MVDKFNSGKTMQRSKTYFKDSSTNDQISSIVSPPIPPPPPSLFSFVAPLSPVEFTKPSVVFPTALKSLPGITSKNDELSKKNNPRHYLTNIYDMKCSISRHVPMKILVSMDDTTLSTTTAIEIARLKKKNVHTIVHIYQEIYAENARPTGLGDFIRSCFYMIQFCRTYQFVYRIAIAHPMALFLQQFGEVALTRRKPWVRLFSPTNWTRSVFNKDSCIENYVLDQEREKEYVEYLNKLPLIKDSGTLYAYNILFPYGVVSQEDKDLVREMLQPTTEMQEYVKSTLIQLALPSTDPETRFIVVHIRSGDKHLLHGSNTFKNTYVKVIKDEIEKIILNNNERKILLIADNNNIKKVLLKDFPGRIVCLFQEITHLGEGVALVRERVKNTLLDFFVMSQAHSIFSFTTYLHGSGFSYWCAMIYGIPYKCRYIAT